MSGFYGQQAPGASTGGGNSGFYGSSNAFGQQQQQQQPSNNGGNTNAYGFGQQQQQASSQQQQQQPAFQQWQAPAPAAQYNAQQQRQSQGHAYTNQQQQILQQQQQTPAPFWNPNMTAAVVGVAAQAASGKISNDAVLDWAMQGGAAAWKSGGASMIPGFDRSMITLRTYFAVDNNYVVAKMKKVLFPFQSTEWRRIENESVGGPDTIVYMLPHSDENAPDLYIPSMSLISYCLLCALCYGTSGQFDPEVIPDVTTNCFIVQVLEVIAIRVGLYMMQVTLPILDLFSYTGYKYLGLCINMFIGLITGHLGYGTTGFYVTFLFTASAASYFMLKTMANNTPTNVSATGPKREIMVLAFAGSQAVTMWLVSQTKFL